MICLKRIKISANHVYLCNSIKPELRSRYLKAIKNNRYSIAINPFQKNVIRLFADDASKINKETTNIEPEKSIPNSNQDGSSSRRHNNKRRQSFFNEFMTNAFEKYFVLDTRMSWKILFFLAPSIMGLIYYYIAYYRNKEETLDSFEKNFQCNIRNIEEGRYYTLISTIFGNGANLRGASVSEIASILLFAGFFIRNYGFLNTSAYYLSGHLLGVISSLIVNHVALKKLENYKEWIKDPDYDNIPLDIKEEKRKYVLSIESELTQNLTNDIEAIERRQLAILRMDDIEFVEVAKERYSTRNSFANGGGLALSLLLLRMYPRSLIPFPYVGIPSYLFITFQAYYTFKSNSQYSLYEFLPSTVGLLSWAFAVGSYMKFINAKTVARALPNPLIEAFKMAKWVPRSPVEVRPIIKNKIEENVKTIIGDTKGLTKAQIEKMRKRNERFRKKEDK